MTQKAIGHLPMLPYLNFIQTLMLRYSIILLKFSLCPTSWMISLFAMSRRSVVLLQWYHTHWLYCQESKVIYFVWWRNQDWIFLISEYLIVSTHSLEMMIMKVVICTQSGGLFILLAIHSAVLLDSTNNTLIDSMAWYDRTTWQQWRANQLHDSKMFSQPCIVFFCWQSFFYWEEIGIKRPH